LIIYKKYLLSVIKLYNRKKMSRGEDMKVYKNNVKMYIVRVVVALVISGFCFFVFSYAGSHKTPDSLFNFAIPGYVPWLVGAAALLVGISFTALGKAVRIEVDEAGSLRYFRGTALVFECELKNCRVYDSAPASTYSSAKGIGVVRPGEKPVVMDCSLMKLRQFQELFALLLRLSASTDGMHGIIQR
jgi:hypothetical protein